MKKILMFGAGLSATTLIKYLLDNAQAQHWKLQIASRTKATAEAKINKHPFGEAIGLDVVNDAEGRRKWIADADIVISMLPAALHMLIANDCLSANKNLVTASYVSPEILALDEKVKDAGIIFMNEVGVDPGIDHMSAMKIIDSIKNQGGTIDTFKSYCGGLMAPGYDNNPWKYKFTWNPRNVVMAGTAGAFFLEDGKETTYTYANLYENTEQVEVLNYGKFDAYGNRDSVIYKEIYGLEGISNLYRATLRNEGYTDAWNILLQLGFTDDQKKYNVKDTTFADFTAQFVNKEGSWKQRIESVLNKEISEISFAKIEWLEIFSDAIIGGEDKTAAQVLEQAMVAKMSLEEGDKDMLVMHHYFKYILNGESREVTSSMVYIGEGNEHTAMSKTVGLPTAIAVKNILNGNISLTGIQVPNVKEIYEPILNELEEYGIKFIEKETVLA
ncbi:saccharopine dehydrogenase C-terminal domain-containing protein [Tenacibaculum aestuariivivum]|uniref:saccharopine dehydrogenase C-terminal domain-containing protein n=1 Tax=Tenacibaculum aestuariivivum TaxID=2006131 RepID=UPI003AB8DDEE